MLTKEQRRLFFLVKAFVLDNLATLSPNARLEFPATLPARDCRILVDIADELHLGVTYDEFDAAGRNLIVLSFEEEMMELAREEGEGEDAEWKDAIKRVISKYEKAEVAKDFDEEEWEDSHAKVLEEKMTTWKKEYYKVSLTGLG